MPSRNCRLRLAPLARGVPSVTVPALMLPLKPLPFGCGGGVSRVVPWTVAVQGGVAGAPVAAQVAASLMPATTTATEVRGLRSAKPDAAGKVSRSMIRKRNRVTEPPVLFTQRRRIESVPNVELFAGSLVKSRTRFGGLLEATVPSTNDAGTVLLRWIGDERFCGPGAPSRCPPPADVPLVSTKIEIHGVVVRVFRRADRARPEQVDSAALSALVTRPGVVDGERGQCRIPSTSLYDVFASLVEPTASNRLASEKLPPPVLLLKSAMPALSGMSVV